VPAVNVRVPSISVYVPLEFSKLAVVMARSPLRFTDPSDVPLNRTVSPATGLPEGVQFVPVDQSRSLPGLVPVQIYSVA
jgi:hypothetical protein